MMDYALTRHLINQNPARLLKPKDFAATASRPRDRVLSLLELRKVWQALYLKTEPHVIERMLNHQPLNKLVATYQRAIYAIERLYRLSHKIFSQCLMFLWVFFDQAIVFVVQCSENSIEKIR